jgi:adenylate cyclase
MTARRSWSAVRAAADRHAMPNSPLAEMGKRCDRRAGAAFALSNLVGAVFIFTFLTYIVPNEQVRGESSAIVDIGIFVAYFAVVGVVGVTWGRRIAIRATQWVAEGRAPDDQERATTLSMVFRLTMMSFVPWAGAAVFYGVINAAAGHTAIHVIKVISVTLDGGLVSCTLSFLLAERAMRPIVALALAGTEPPRRALGGVRVRLLLTWVLGSAVPLAGIALLPLVARDATVHADIGASVAVLSCAGLLAGGLITVGTANAVADPLHAVTEALESVRQGKLDVEVPVDGGGDIGLLESGMNRMVEGLRERHRLADLFGRHVGTEVASLALEQGTGMASEHREASALFVDLIGSTALAEVLEPDAVVETLNAFFDAVVSVVAAEGGWVNKFAGDGALCVFGAPATQPDHAARALRAARRLHDELLAVGAAHPGVDAAIGVSSGVVVAGNVGTEQRYEYTVIGRPVNEASRLTDLAKGRAGRVLASAAALSLAPTEAARWGSLGTLALRGQAAPIEVYEPAVKQASTVSP